MAEHAESVGSVGEEAVKLLAALKGLGEHGTPEDSEHTGRRRDDDGQQFRDTHSAPNGSTSCWCPLCRAVGALKQFHPEVGEHLAAAASELAHAGAVFLQSMSTPPPHQEAAQSSERTSSRGDDEDLEDA